METKKTVIGQGKFLSLVKKDGWEYVERTNASAVVAIAGLTVDWEWVLVEQFRPALGKRVIELPAGLVGDEIDDEELEAAAKRELEEETGYQAEKMSRSGTYPSSSGLTSEVVTVFHATGLTKTGSGGGVGAEDIKVHVVGEYELLSWLLNRKKEGLLIDPKVYIAHMRP